MDEVTAIARPRQSDGELPTLAKSWDPLVRPLALGCFLLALIYNSAALGGIPGVVLPNSLPLLIGIACVGFAVILPRDRAVVVPLGAVGVLAMAILSILWSQDEASSILWLRSQGAVTLGIPVSVDTYKPEVMRAVLDAGADIVGVMHSHTHTEPYPSVTDVNQAPDPSWHYVIVSLRDELPMLRSYRIVDGVITEEPVEIAPFYPPIVTEDLSAHLAGQDTSGPIRYAVLSDSNGPIGALWAATALFDEACGWEPNPAHPDADLEQTAAVFHVPARQLVADLNVLWFCGLPGGMPGDLIEVDMDALAEGRIGGALLDVTTPEPLPESDPLWGLENTHVTMHLSGRAQELSNQRSADRFIENLARYHRGEPLHPVVDYALGY